MIILKDTYWLEHLDECYWDSEYGGYLPQKDASNAVKESFSRYNAQLERYHELEEKTGKIIV